MIILGWWKCFQLFLLKAKIWLSNLYDGTGGWVTIRRIMPLCGSILQVGTCQIFSLAENPRLSRVWQYYLNFILNNKILHYQNLVCSVQTHFRVIPTPSPVYYQLAWPQLETQLGQNSAWAKATTAFILRSVCLSVCLCVCVSDKASVPFLKIIFTTI